MSLTPDLSIFRHRSYTHYWTMLVLMAGARNLQFVVILAEVYLLAKIGRSESEAYFLLGLVGLVQFLPVFFFSLVGGQAADRYSQRGILVIFQLLRAFVSLLLVASVFMATGPALITLFISAALLGLASAFTPAASGALYPRLVSREELPQAITWNSLGRQTSSVAFPAIGGLIYGFAGAEYVFGFSALMCLAGAIAVATMGAPPQQRSKNAAGLDMVIEGLKYVGQNKIVLGAISLDLVVVFFGSVTFLLPPFAFDILKVGEEGLGYLQSAMAIGTVSVAYLLATRPLTRNVGRWMFGSVVVFGLGILLFAVSKVFWLSMLALAIAGAGDMVSMFIRSSLIQLATPDEMKGRVSSVSFLFISASNELGNFESGVAARFLGPIGASVFGGVIAIGSAGIWWKLFPQLAKADTFEDIKEIAV